MDIADKIVSALTHSLHVEYVRLNSGDPNPDKGITGFVVSPEFEEMTSLGRQERIESALSKMLTPKENRQVLMIAGVTPLEYDSVGSRIRVQQVREVPDGTLQVLLHGTLSDAEYVRGAINNQKGVQTTEPEQVPGAVGTLMSFTARSKESDVLSKSAVIRTLGADRYIEVMCDA